MSLLYCGCSGVADKAIPKTESDSAIIQRDTSTTWALLSFVKADSVNPDPSTGGCAVFADPVLHKKVLWEEKDVFNPAIVVKDDKVYMLYRAQDSMGTSRIGLAESADGIHFIRQATPVFYPLR